MVLFDALCALVAPALVQDQLCRRGSAVGDEGDLRVHDFQEVIAIALRKNLKFRLVRCLHEKVIALPSNGDNEGRRQLILSDLTVEQFRINGDLLVFSRRRY